MAALTQASSCDAGAGVAGSVRRRVDAADEVAALAGRLARSQQQLRTAGAQLQQLQADNARWGSGAWKWRWLMQPPALPTSQGSL
jgi:hypothetical protein